MPVVTPANMNQTQLIAPQEASTPVIEQAVQSEAKPQAPQMSPQFAALARKERELRHQAQSIKAEREAMKSREAEIQAQAQNEWKQRLTSNPWDVLLEAGLTPEQATHLIINQPQPKDIEFQNLQKELKSIKDAQLQAQEQSKALQDQNYNQAKKQIHTEVKLLVDSDPNYETIKEMSAQSAVTELIEQTFAQDGHLMSIEDAAKEVEDYLLNQALRLTKLKKIQSRMIPEQPLRSQAPQKPQLQTLTNRINPATKPSSERERKQRAILAFQGKLG